MAGAYSHPATRLLAVNRTPDSGSTNEGRGACAPQSHRQSEDHSTGLLPSKPRRLGMKPLMVQPIRPDASAITTFCDGPNQVLVTATPSSTFLASSNCNWVRLADSGRKAVQTANRTVASSSSLETTSTNGPRELRSPTKASPSMGAPRRRSLGPNVSNHQPSSSRCSLISA